MLALCMCIKMTGLCLILADWSQLLYQMRFIRAVRLQIASSSGCSFAIIRSCTDELNLR
jgi:hypothetical protein